MPATTILERPAEAEAGYEADFHLWALAQAKLLLDGKLGEADIANIAEEIESLGREQFSKVRSALVVILLHMLKWDHQPERRSRSWATSIRDQRDALEDVVEDSPSLRRRRTEALDRAYRRARNRAADETELPLSRFPVECPYSLDDILGRPFRWPDE